MSFIRDSRRIVALTGAGISTQSGIPDFRGPKGMYASGEFDPETIFDIHVFEKNPAEFFHFARSLIHLLDQAIPGPAHHFLARLEDRRQCAGVVTQNIDGLHQQAGSRNVLEMHGSVRKGHCQACGRAYSWECLREMIFKNELPLCSCASRGVIKPDIVFFGEPVEVLKESGDLVESSDLLFVIGTSCSVFPAAALPSMCPGRIVVVNQTPVELPVFNVSLSVQEDLNRFFENVAKCV